MHATEINGSVSGTEKLSKVADAPSGPHESLHNGLTNGNVEKQTSGLAPKGWREELDDDDHAVLALRNLIFDICNQNGGGHGGSAIGMSAIGVALYKYVMRYNPADSEWFDRDRFVLSNGKLPAHEGCATLN